MISIQTPRSYEVLSLDICFICVQNNEINAHLFMLCLVVWGLWSSLWSARSWVGCVLLQWRICCKFVFKNFEAVGMLKFYGSVSYFLFYGKFEMSLMVDYSEEVTYLLSH